VNEAGDPGIVDENVEASVSVEDRRRGRAEAKRRFTLEEHVAATAGAECRKNEGVLDETPMAYKDIDVVMAAQSDLEEIVRASRSCAS
jgi:tRNA-splicing ligase RtcB